MGHVGPGPYSAVMYNTVLICDAHLCVPRKKDAAEVGLQRQNSVGKGRLLTMRPVLKLSTVSSGFELAATRRLLFLCAPQAQDKPTHKRRNRRRHRQGQEQKHVRDRRACRPCPPNSGVQPARKRSPHPQRSTCSCAEHCMRAKSKEGEWGGVERPCTASCLHPCVHRARGCKRRGVERPCTDRVEADAQLLELSVDDAQALAGRHLPHAQALVQRRGRHVLIV